MAGLSQGAGGLAQEGNGAGPRTRIIQLAKTNMTGTILSQNIKTASGQNIDAQTDSTDPS